MYAMADLKKAQENANNDRTPTTDAILRSTKKTIAETLSTIYHIHFQIRLIASREKSQLPDWCQI